MAIPTSCPTCNRSGTVPDAYAGKPVRCPGCQTIINVPSQGGTAASSFANLETTDDSTATTAVRNRAGTPWYYWVCHGANGLTTAYTLIVLAILSLQALATLTATRTATQRTADAREWGHAEEHGSAGVRQVVGIFVLAQLATYAGAALATVTVSTLIMVVLDAASRLRAFDNALSRKK